MTSAGPIRIARIITRLNVGGPAIQAVALSDRLESIGYHTLLVHGSVSPGEGDMSYLIPTSHRFEVEHVRTLRREIAPTADAATLASIVRRLSRFRPHIVHTHMAKAGSLGRAAAVLANMWRPHTGRARIIHTYHGHVLDGYFSPRAARAFTTAERMLARRSDALVAVSPAVRRDLIETHRIGSAGQFEVVPLGFDLQPFTRITDAERADAKRRFNLTPSARVVSLIGRLTSIKQPDVFLDIAARIAQADTDAVFLIAGGGDLELAARSQAARAGLDGRVRFLGWQRDMAAIYAASDLIALTSRNEGTPVALIESMAAAVPAVAFSVGGVPDVIATPDTGVLIRENDVEEFAAKTLALLRDDGARRAMGARARASVAQRYDLDRLVRDVDALYRRVL